MNPVNKDRSGRELRGSRARLRRRAAALVEFAICLPVLVLVILGSIEAATAVFVRQGLTVAAYEGIREAIRIDGNLSTARGRAQAVLDQRSIKGAKISFQPANPMTLPRGEIVTLRVESTLGANSPFFGSVLQNRRILVSTSMVRE